MLTLDQEQAQLVKAELDIAAGQQRVAALEQRIREMRLKGRDTGPAEELLATFQATLAQWHAHRQEILRSIRRLEST
jgi:hypothetical protein